jgi:flagellar protein FliS
MSYQRMTDAYQTTSVLSSSREQLVPVLYEHLLVSLRRAAKQIQSGDIQGKAESVEKATAILYELLGSLDHDADSELASRLASLYTYFLKEINEASWSLKARRLDPVIEMVGSLHESWVEAARLVSEQNKREEARSSA